MIFQRENGLTLKLAPKHRALLLHDGLETPPGVLDEPWSRLRISAKLGGKRVKRYWSRHWPLVTGFIQPEGRYTGGRLNPLATALIDTADEHEAVFGQALLLGYDPSLMEPCSIPDEAIIAATEAFWELRMSD